MRVAPRRAVLLSHHCDPSKAGSLSPIKTASPVLLIASAMAIVLRLHSQRVVRVRIDAQLLVQWAVDQGQRGPQGCDTSLEEVATIKCRAEVAQSLAELR